MRLAVTVLLVVVPSTFAQTGKALYMQHCAPCHGERGHDGFAANLAVPRLPHAPDERSLLQLIRAGFPGTDMPPAFGITDAEARQIASFVRTLGRAAPQKVTGDRKQGQEIYNTKGSCATCHMLRGHGGRQGPDLSDIGARRSASHLRQSLTEPEAALPHDFLLLEVTTAGGRKVSGVRLNEDSFSIQVRDLDGGLHSFQKSELTHVNKQWGKTTMPSYRSTLTAAELDNLIAFLVSLRGEL